MSSMGTPWRMQEGTGEEGQSWVMAAAWHGKHQGGCRCSLGWDRGDGLREGVWGAQWDQHLIVQGQEVPSTSCCFPATDMSITPRQPMEAAIPVFSPIS